MDLLQPCSSPRGASGHWVLPRGWVLDRGGPRCLGKKPSCLALTRSHSSAFPALLAGTGPLP